MGIADEIFKNSSLRRELVDVPEWGVSFYVQEFSAKVRQELNNKLKEVKDGSLYAALLIIYSSVDEDGEFVFNQDEHLEKILELSNETVERVATVAGKLNGMLPEDDEEESEKK